VSTTCAGVVQDIDGATHKAMKSQLQRELDQGETTKKWRWRESSALAEKTRIDSTYDARNKEALFWKFRHAIRDGYLTLSTCHGQ